jgi:preprotein translocase subunit YajC
MLQNIFLQAAASQGSPIFTMVMMGGIILVFYFFMIRPQSKKFKDQKKFVSDMQKGDKCVTIGGIHGTINKINDDETVMLETSPGSYMKIEKSTISLEWSAKLNAVAAVK